MTEQEVLRYIRLAHRKSMMAMRSGVNWEPEYAQELRDINKELIVLRKKVDEEHKKRVHRVAAH